MDAKLVDKWIEYHTTHDRGLYWAWEQLDDIVHNSPKEAFEYILTIAQATSNQEVLASLGAGPLEDFLVLYGPEYIQQVEIKARQLPNFTNVVKCVWQNDMQPDIWKRISEIQAKYS